MQPADYDDLGAQPPYPEHRPRTGIPKVIGILNIVFGSLLMLCSICMGLGLAAQFAAGPMFAAQQQVFQQILEADRQQKLQDLQKRAQAAKNDKDKAEIQVQERALKAQPLPKLPDMTKFMQDPALQGYSIADVVSSLILNILLLVSGIGLVRYAEWGRRLGLWIAAIKIVRLVVIYGFFIVVVVPRVTKAITSIFQEMVQEMAKAAPPGQRIPGPAEMAQMGTSLGIMYTVLAIGMVIFGVIYPIIVLILLSRPRVKAACKGAATAPDSPQGVY
jgi:hypothetical protein